MHTINVNGTRNYKWNLSHDIRQAINSMSEDRKRSLLEDIQLKKQSCNLFDEAYNDEACRYIETLLNNKHPQNGLARRNGNGHDNGVS